MIKNLLNSYYRILKLVLTALLGLMVVPVSLQILSRYTGLIPRFIWTEEAARFCFVWLIMIGSIIAVRDRTHFDVDLLPHPGTRRGKALANLIVNGTMILMALVFTGYGFRFAAFGYRQTSEMSGINMLSIYGSFPLAGMSWTLFLLEGIANDIKMIATSKPAEPA